MAWHLRTALGHALWRSDAGIPLTDHHTPPERVDDLAARFTMRGIDPEAPRPLGSQLSWPSRVAMSEQIHSSVMSPSAMR